MYNEKKFIIVKKYGHLKHLKFPGSLFHDTFARDNGYYWDDVVETGLIRNKRIIIVECRDRRRYPRIEHKMLFSDIELRAREAETRYAYRSKNVYELPNGD